MATKSIAFTCFCSTATAGLVAILVADEVRNMATHTAGYSTTSAVPGRRWSSRWQPGRGPAPRQGRRRSVRWNQPRRLADARGRAGAVEGERWVHGSRPGHRTDRDQGRNSATFNCMSSGPRPTRRSARARTAATAASSSWAHFELQVLDSYRADTYADGQAGAIYGQYPPLANASRPPGEWQTYDIAFRRPRFDTDGKLLEPARFTVIHNGILVQNNEELWGGTNWLEPAPYEDHGDRGPIELQDHGHKVRFRNIWLRELPERPAPPADYLSGGRSFPSQPRFWTH